MKILIVEDDLHIHEIIQEYLTKEGYTCVSAYSGSEAVLRIQQESFDVVLLDLMLPGMRGEDVFKQVKQQSTAAVIILSAKDDVDTKVALLQQGVDDYICKPFDLKELKARIDIRSKQPMRNTSSRQGIVLEEDLRTVRYEDKTQTLTRHEYAILELLMTHPKRAFTKQEIYEYAWNQEAFIEDKTIHVHISNLRSKLSKLVNYEVIETIWGIGFKWKENL